MTWLPKSSYASLLPSAEGDLAWPPDAAPTGKTSETVKEQLCFTPSIFWVNRKSDFVCALNSMECTACTGACSGSSAARPSLEHSRGHLIRTFSAFFTTRDQIHSRQRF